MQRQEISGLEFRAPRPLISCFPSILAMRPYLPSRALNINYLQWLMNLGSTDIPAPWEFSISNPNYMGLSGIWNSQLSSMDASTGTITGSVHEVMPLALHYKTTSHQCTAAVAVAGSAEALNMSWLDLVGTCLAPTSGSWPTWGPAVAEHMALPLSQYIQC